MARHSESLSAITLVTADMPESFAFYRVLGAECVFGGADSTFATFTLAEEQFLNLQFDATWTPPARVWGRFIVWVDDVDAVYEGFVNAGYVPRMEPSDAVWGERYFHILDPAGHELSIARRIDG